MQRNCTTKYSLILIIGLILFSLIRYIIFYRKMVFLDNTESQTVIFLSSYPNNCRFQTKEGFDFVINNCEEMQIGKEYTILGRVNSMTDKTSNYSDNFDVTDYFVNSDNRVSFFNNLWTFFVFFDQFVDNCRQTILSNLQSYFVHEQFQLIAALTLGNKTFDFDPSLKQAFQEVGLSHMVAVSGFHLSVVMVILTEIINMILPKNKTKLLLLSGLFFYVLLVGRPLSVLRAALMWSYSFIGSTFFNKQTLSFLGFIFSLILMFNLSILNLFNVGFLLSFASTFGIIMLANKIVSWLDKSKIEGSDLSKWQQKLLKFAYLIVGMIGVSVAAQLFTLPISILVFEEYALSGILSTLLFSSLITVIVILGVVLMLMLSLKVLGVLALKLFIQPLVFYLELISYLFYKLFNFYSLFFAGLIQIQIAFNPIWVGIYYLILLFLIWILNKNGKKNLRYV